MNVPSRRILQQSEMDNQGVQITALNGVFELDSSQETATAALPTPTRQATNRQQTLQPTAKPSKGDFI